MKIIALIFALFLSSCTTLEGTANSRGSGVRAEFKKPYDVVFKAAAKAVKSSALVPVSDNKEQGKILAHTNLSFWSAGENVAVLVDKKDEKTTTVEVISKRKSYLAVFAKDWEYEILTDIKKRLED